MMCLYICLWICQFYEEAVTNGKSFLQIFIILLHHTSVLTVSPGIVVDTSPNSLLFRIYKPGDGGGGAVFIGIRIIHLSESGPYEDLIKTKMY